MKKLSALVLLLVLTLLILTGCYSGYSGEHTDLYTVAINSISWTFGHSFGADFPMDSEIEIIEQDQYGRTLFTYYEEFYSGGDITFSSLVVCQSSNEQHAFYYEDVNFIVKEQEVDIPWPVNEFTNEEIEQLKLANDWNKPLNLEKCVKKELVTEKPDIPHEKKIEKIIEEDFQLDARDTIFVHYLTKSAVSDNYIIYGYLRGCTDFHIDFHIYFIGLVEIENDKIKDVHFLQPTNVFDYQTELMEFKKAHNWK